MLKARHFERRPFRYAYILLAVYLAWQTIIDCCTCRKPNITKCRTSRKPSITWCPTFRKPNIIWSRIFRKPTMLISVYLDFPTLSRWPYNCRDPNLIRLRSWAKRRKFQVCKEALTLTFIGKKCLHSPELWRKLKPSSSTVREWSRKTRNTLFIYRVMSKPSEYTRLKLLCWSLSSVGKLPQVYRHHHATLTQSPSRSEPREKEYRNSGIADKHDIETNIYNIKKYKTPTILFNWRKPTQMVSLNMQTTTTTPWSRQPKKDMTKNQRNQNNNSSRTQNHEDGNETKPRSVRNTKRL